MKTDPSLPARLAQLLEALRQELHQYGEMLARLDHQQEAVMVRAADDVLQSALAVREQLHSIQEARQAREQIQKTVARSLQQTEEAPFASLLPAMPEKYRLAIEALVRENNELLTRVQQRARQNHLLLSRSIEMMQQLIGALMPVAPPKTYTGEGELGTAEKLGHALYEAVG